MHRAVIEQFWQELIEAGGEISAVTMGGHVTVDDVNQLCHLLEDPDGFGAWCFEMTRENYIAAKIHRDQWNRCTGTTRAGERCQLPSIYMLGDISNFVPGIHDRCKLHRQEQGK